jgi:hypothetical protein
MAEDTVEQRLQASIAVIREEMATKADFEVAIATAVAGLATKDDLAGIARNVDITTLGRQVGQAIAETRAMRADMRLLTGIVTGMATSVQALVDHQMQLADRVSALEEPTK